jgi:hypothetical protein
MTIAEVLDDAGIGFHHAGTPMEIDELLRKLPFQNQRGTMLLDPVFDERVGAWTGEVVKSDMPMFYLTNTDGDVLAILQYSGGSDVLVSLLWVPETHRQHGYGSLLAALAMREKARSGPFSCGGFITNVYARNIHYGLFEVAHPPITKEQFDPDGVTYSNEVEDWKKADAVARAILARMRV